MTLPSFPIKRMRRMRFHEFSRDLMKETRLHPSDLILPVFIHEQKDDQPIKSMPGQSRLSFDSLFRTAERCLELQIPAMMLFPVIAETQKSLNAKEAYNEKGLVPKVVLELKKRFPSLGIITDIALDPYTSHGQDGLINESGYVLNDETIAVLQQQALTHAQAGADVVAPSDMMDGRIKAIREALDERQFIHTQILSYAAKYCSSYYGPFRDAVGSAKALGKADKRSYQLDPANTWEALNEVALDVSEGADMILVKPAGPYMDIIHQVKERFQMPTFAYQVSGEYAMIKAAAMQGWIKEEDCMMESILGLKRAGCDAIVTYFALDAAQILSNRNVC